MAKLYFKYGAMGSSKTAQALITKYNYEENDLRVWLVKPSADTRDGKALVRSRIGLEASADIIPPETDLLALFRDRHLHSCDVIIVDECQFLTQEQIDQLSQVSGKAAPLPLLQLKDKAVRFTRVTDKQDMERAVLEML